LNHRLINGFKINRTELVTGDREQVKKSGQKPNTTSNI